MAQNQTLAPIDEVRGTLTRMAPQFKAALPAQIPVERFVRVVQTAIATNTDLLAVERTSLYAAAMKCAQDGLLPDGREAAIVKYGNTARYMPMVGGIAKKARNSGELKTLSADVVYDHDTYDHWSDEKGEHFEHRKARGNRGDVVLTYAYALTKDDGFYFEEIDEAQMAAIEKCSKANDGPWKGPFKDEMRKKSAIRRLAKYRLPSSSDSPLDAVLRADDDMYDLNQSQSAPPINVTPQGQAGPGAQQSGRRRGRALQQVVNQQQAPPAPTDQPATSQPAAATPASTEPPKSSHPTDVI